ncbi:DUF4350 domain-containing protein [Microbacterium ulmi]|uniref:DUF4350 domain-containing protein n=1 Tax=Microbacterium ulmi TaxID=179095 RepID=UPI001ABAC847|nr:DUF4350 domain-containing protein [Microbacterium ulmi]NII70393.1 hypothetical protein [Microbacterium ulmi]
MSAVTELRRGRARRVATWGVIGAVIVVVALVGVALAQRAVWEPRDALDPDSHGPTGTRAVAQLLRGQGVDVVVARDRAAAADALARGDATLALPDAPALSDEAVTALTAAATDVVLLDPRTRTLRLLFPDSAIGGAAPEVAVEPGCDLAEARRAGAVAPGTVFTPGADSRATSCYETPAGWGLLVQSGDDHRRSAVDGRALFTNERLAVHGNAALALAILGRHATVVWYVPSISDSDLSGAAPSLGELTPSWVSPVLALLLASALAAAVWRGRRFGPLVAERLPVTVRASETTEGRARLYSRSRDAVHAADELRIGALRRIGRVLALGPSASAGEIADAAAARTGRDRIAVRGILLDDLPRTDAQLVALHDRLRALEDAVHAAARPSTAPRAAAGPDTAAGTHTPGGSASATGPGPAAAPAPAPRPTQDGRGRTTGTDARPAAGPGIERNPS